MLSKYFSESEMKCKCSACGNTCAMDSTFLKLLDQVRTELGEPIFVSSGFRCNAHNIDIGGVSNSWHTKGRAADCTPKSKSLQDLYDVAVRYFKEVIIYSDDGFVHIAEPK